MIKNEEIPLAKRDLYLFQIQEEIKNKKSLLIKKKKELDKKVKDNIFLKNVQEDYTKYYQYILKEKQQQYDALLLLKEYMGDLKKTEKMMNSQLLTVKYDEKQIMDELDKVKKELDELIQ